MRSTARRPGFREPAVLLIFLGILLAACGGAAGPAAVPAGGDTRGAAGEQDGGGSGGGDTGNGNGGNAPGGDKPAQYSVDQQNLLIIKNGTITLQVTGIDDALAAANQQIDALGGYASGSERSGDGDSATASVTFRIPADRWDEALGKLRAIATKVVDERTSTEDVTSQVVDLGARIKNLQATETALQAIMARATEIKDVLAVQAELTSVRGQIEQLTAQKSSLEERAAFSTLTVTLTLKPDPVLTETQRFDPSTEVDQASASLVGILQALATAGIWFAIVWLPIIVAIAIIGLVGLAIARRIQRTRGGATPLAPSTGIDA